MSGRMSDLLRWLGRDQMEPRSDEFTLATAGESAAPAAVATCQQLGMVEGKLHAECNNGYRAPETIRVQKWGRIFDAHGSMQHVLACPYCDTLCVDTPSAAIRAPQSGDSAACGILDVGDDCPRCEGILDGAWECVDVVRCPQCGWRCTQ